MSKFFSRRGFTLIELLIVVIIIGIIAAIALPRFTDVKKKAYVSTVSSDLRTLATSQEVAASDDTAGFYKDCANMSATSLCDGLRNFTPSPDVRLTSVAATDTTAGWLGNSRHLKPDAGSSRCLNVGTITPGDTVAGYLSAKPAGSQYTCNAAY